MHLCNQLFVNLRLVTPEKRRIGKDIILNNTSDRTGFYCEICKKRHEGTWKIEENKLKLEWEKSDHQIQATIIRIYCEEEKIPENVTRDAWFRAHPIMDGPTVPAEGGTCSLCEKKIGIEFEPTRKAFIITHHDEKLESAYLIRTNISFDEGPRDNTNSDDSEETSEPVFEPPKSSESTENTIPEETNSNKVVPSMCTII